MIPDDFADNAADWTPLSAAVAIDPEVCFVGALLHHDADTVADLASVVELSDFENPHAAVVFALVTELAAAGMNPDPSTVVAHAQRSGKVTGKARLDRLATFVIAAFTNVPLLHCISMYRADVIGNALRRRVRVAGDRLIQAADNGSEQDMLDALDAETDAIKDTFIRARKAR